MNILVKTTLSNCLKQKSYNLNKGMEKVNNYEWSTGVEIFPAVYKIPKNYGELVPEMVNDLS